MSHLKRSLTGAAIALMLAACSGGGGGGSAGPGGGTGAAPPANTAPTISGLPDSQTMDVNDSSEPLTFTVSDAQSNASLIQVTAESSNAALIPVSSVTLGGSGGSRTMTLVPEEDATGSAVITLVATDPASVAFRKEITVNVTAASREFAEMVSAAYAQPNDAEPLNTTGYSWVPTEDPAAFDSLVE